MVLEFSDLVADTITVFGVLAVAWALADQLSQLISYITWRFSKTGEQQ